jgi:prevent-host-death family protein
VVFRELIIVKATATEVKNNLGKYLKISKNEDVIITKNGKEIACLSKYDPDARNKYLICESSSVYTSGPFIRGTYEEYTRLVEDSRNRYEYINGVIYLLASPTHNHQLVSSRINGVFFNWFKGKKCKSFYAPYDVNIPIDKAKNTVQPDILVICDNENVDEKGRYHGIPALVVEVLSPSTKNKDMVAKLELYMKGGVGEFWIVDPESQEVLVYTFKDKNIDRVRAYKGRDTVQSAYFKGLNIKHEDMFY